MYVYKIIADVQDITKPVPYDTQTADMISLMLYRYTLSREFTSQGKTVMILNDLKTSPEVLVFGTALATQIDVTLEAMNSVDQPFAF